MFALASKSKCVFTSRSARAAFFFSHDNFAVNEEIVKPENILIKKNGQILCALREALRSRE